MYLKERDKQIRRFVEEYGGITINICANLFFKNSNQKYLLSSKRLRILYLNNYLKRYRKDMYTEVVYYLDTPPKEHTIKLLELYSRLCLLGTVTEFKVHYSFKAKNKKRQLDALMELEIKNKDGIFNYPLIIEIDSTHNTNLKRMEDIYCSEHFQDMYNGVFPYVIIVKRNLWQPVFSTELFGYKFLTWEMDGLEDIFNGE